MNRLITLRKGNAFLSVAATASICDLSKRLKADVFASFVWPHISEGLSSDVTEWKAEDLLSFIELAEKFPVSSPLPSNAQDVVDKNARFLSAGRIVWSENSRAELVRLFKVSVFCIYMYFQKMDLCVRGALAGGLLLVARRNGQFHEVYRDVIEKWALQGPELKVRCLSKHNVLRFWNACLK